jgi:hypothetical protein
MRASLGTRKYWRWQMNHDSLVQRGYLPWSPRAEASDLDVWHEYETPLVGTFVLRGTTVLFTVIGDAGTRLSVWAYVCLTDDEAEAASTVEFGSAEELQAYANELFMSRKVVFALADDLLIDRWSPLFVKDELLEAASGFMTDILNALDPKTKFEAKLAEANAVAEHRDNSRLASV